MTFNRELMPAEDPFCRTHIAIAQEIAAIRQQKDTKKFSLWTYLSTKLSSSTNLSGNWEKILIEESNELEKLRKKPESKLRQRVLIIQYLVVIQKIIRQHENDPEPNSHGDENLKRLSQELRELEYKEFQKELLNQISGPSTNIPNLNEEKIELLVECELWESEIKAMEELLNTDEFKSGDKKKLLTKKLHYYTKSTVQALNKQTNKNQEKINELAKQLHPVNSIIITDEAYVPTPPLSEPKRVALQAKLVSVETKKQDYEQRLTNITKKLTELNSKIDKDMREEQLNALLKEKESLQNQIIQANQTYDFKEPKFYQKSISLLGNLIGVCKKLEIHYKTEISNTHNPEEKHLVEKKLNHYEQQIQLHLLNIKSLKSLVEASNSHFAQGKENNLTKYKTGLNDFEKSLSMHRRERDHLDHLLKHPDQISEDEGNSAQARLSNRKNEIETALVELGKGLVLDQGNYQKLSKKSFRDKFSDQITKLIDDGIHTPSIIDGIANVLNGSIELMETAEIIGSIYKWKNNDWAKLLGSQSDTKEALSKQLTDNTEAIKKINALLKDAPGMPETKKTEINAKKTQLQYECDLITNELATQKEFDSFASQVNKCKNRIAMSRTREEVLKDKIYLLSKDIESKLTVEAKAPLMKWQEQLQAMRLEARHGTIEATIQLRELMLKRFIDVVNKLQCQIIQLSKEISVLEINIEKNRKKLDVPNISAENIMDTEDAIRRETIKLSNCKDSLTALKSRVEIFDKAFDKQLGKYEKIRRPKKSFQKALKEGTIEMLKDAVTWNLFKSHQCSPNRFRIEKQFANLGYTMTGALQLENWKEGDNLTAIIKNNVKDFLVWADKHPVAAASLAADIALTVSMLGDKETLDTLIDSMKTKMNVHAALGILGREAEVEIVEQSDLRFQALADLAQYGPAMVSGVNVLTSSLKGLASGGILGAISNGLDAGLNGSKNALIQQAVQNMSVDNLEIANNVLKIVRGDSFSEILVSAQTSKLIEIAGNIRLAVTRPKTVSEGIKNRLLEVKGTFNELSITGRLGFVALLAGVPVVGVSAIALAFALPIALPAAVMIGVIGLGVLGLSALSPFVLIQNVFSGAAKRAKKNMIQEVATSSQYQNEIKKQAKDYLQKLIDKKVLLDQQVPELSAEFLDRKPENELQNLIKALTKSSIEQLRVKMEKEKADLNNEDLIPSEVVALYNNFEFEKLVDEQLKQVIDKNTGDGVLSDAIYNNLIDRDELKNYLTLSVKEKIVKEWLDVALKEAFTHEFQVILSHYDSPQQFVNQQKQRIPLSKEAVTSRVKDLKAAVGTQLKSELNLSVENIDEFLKKAA